MIKRFFLLAAMLGLTTLGTVSATGQVTSPTEPDFGACRYYCGSHSYTTLAQCSAVCGGPSNCDKIC
jgi:hypothetical protein